MPAGTTVSASWSWARLLFQQEATAGLWAALGMAGLVTAFALPAALLIGLLLNRTGFWLRLAAQAGCVGILLLHVVGIDALVWRYPPDLAELAFAAARPFAAATLLLTAGLSRIPATLRTAARAAGATPWQAWRHSILCPLRWPLLAALAAAFSFGLAQGPLGARASLAFTPLDGFIAAVTAPLFIACIAALGLLPRRRQA